MPSIIDDYAAIAEALKLIKPSSGAIVEATEPSSSTSIEGFIYGIPIFCHEMGKNQYE